MGMSNGLVAQLAAALSGDNPDPGDIKNRAAALQTYLDADVSGDPNLTRAGLLIAAVAGGSESPDPGDIINRARALSTSFAPTAGTTELVRTNLAPAVPATGVEAANTSNGPVAVYLTGGTVTAVTIDGVVTGLTSGVFVVGPGGEISVTYSVVPTWVWVGF